jgi:triosephosphate isomerase
MRKTLVAGNWKLHETPSETVRLIEEIKPLVVGARAEVAVCPPTSSLFAARQALKGSSIALGAQNMFFEDSDAFTGETSPDALLELGVEYIIVGHLERRKYFAETDETVNKKILKALSKGLKPIVCAEETPEQKERGATDEVVRLQACLALSGVPANQIEDVVFAY